MARRCAGFVEVAACAALSKAVAVMIALALGALDQARRDYPHWTGQMNHAEWKSARQGRG
jgi:hypothetical protein